MEIDMALKWLSREILERDIIAAGLSSLLKQGGAEVAGALDQAMEEAEGLFAAKMVQRYPDEVAAGTASTVARRICSDYAVAEVASRVPATAAFANYRATRADNLCIRIQQGYDAIPEWELEAGSPAPLESAEPDEPRELIEPWREDLDDQVYGETL